MSPAPFICHARLRLAALPLVLIAPCLISLWARADQGKPVPRTVTLQGDNVPLSKALARLRKDTGVAVVDDRGPVDVPLRLDLVDAPFWHAIGVIASQANARVVLSARGDLVRLVRPAPDDRVPPTSLAGDFRFRILRVSASRDLDSTRSATSLSLEVAWSPALRPLYLDSQVQKLRVADAKGNRLEVPSEGSSLTSVEGRGSLTLDVNLPGFGRQQQEIGLVEGEIHAVVPSKFLAFRFDADLAGLSAATPGGAVRRLTQDDVVCRVDRIALGQNRWTVRIGLNYPPGMKELESWQAGGLVVHNELVLASKDGKRRLAPTSYVVEVISSRRALVSYHFEDRLGASRGAPAEWKVAYHAPARIVEMPVKFSFKKVPLP